MYQYKLTDEQRSELVQAADNGEILSQLARRFGISITLTCRIIKQAKEDKKRWQLPPEMLDLYDVLKRKVGGKAARQMVFEHMQLRGMPCPDAVDELALGPTRNRGATNGRRDSAARGARHPHEAGDARV